MKVHKNSKKADQVGDLYRAAFYLAKGEVALGLKFLNNNPYSPYSSYSSYQLTTDSKTRLILAEKLLDLYKLQLRIPDLKA